MRIVHSWVYLLLLSLMVACVSKDYYEINLEPSGQEIALPIINGNLLVSSFEDDIGGNTSIQVGDEGRLTVFYEGNIIHRTSPSIFPPLPFFNDFPILDTIYPLELPIEGEFVLNKAEFKISTIFFKFRTEIQEDIHITMRMPELSKDGQDFIHEYDIIYSGEDSTYFESPPISLDGWLANTVDNTIYFDYDAVTASGESIVLDFAAMNIDIIRFEYVEGFFGLREFELEGNAIPIGIFKNWLSGGFSFDLPKITLNVDNAFGFPVRAKFNNLELVTLAGDILPVESKVLDEGINFNYPAINEIGNVEFTSFSFDNTNSNIADIFNEKAISVNYDIAAFANPEDEDPVIGFFEEESFFNVQAKVEVPLHTRINELVLQDTISYDLDDFESLENGVLKLNVRNSLPVELDLKLLFLDDDGNELSVFNNGDWISINAANVAEKPSEDQMNQSFEVSITADDLNSIAANQNVLLRIKLNTAEEDYFWIHDYQGMDFNLGLYGTFK